MNRKVTIVGAGLVGCLWAVLLRKLNYEVTVYEKRPDIRKNTSGSGRSINLIITSRGLFGLEKAGLLREAFQHSVPVYGRMIHSKEGELAYQPYGQDNEKNLSISRSDFNKFLLDATEKSGAQIHFGHSLENVDFNNKRLHFKNEVQSLDINYDLLFATDGSGSIVRKTLLDQYPQDFQGGTDWLPVDYKELFLPSGSQLEKNALHIWPRGSHMMMALANLDRSFTVTLYLPKTGPKSFETIKTKSQVESFFATDFADAIPMMPQYLNDYMEHPEGNLGTVKISKWILGDSVALMGDAAHAILPFFGQGMNSGFEDCTNLLNIMAGSNSWDEILHKFDQSQRPNANAIADMAKENWIEMSEKVADPKFQMRKKVESVLEKKFPQTFKSRYGMVTYTLIPYSLIQKAGHLQGEILTVLCNMLKNIDQLNLDEAEKLLNEQYVPFLKEHNIKHTTYLG